MFSLLLFSSNSLLNLLLRKRGCPLLSRLLLRHQCQAFLFMFLLFRFSFLLSLFELLCSQLVDFLLLFDLHTSWVDN